MPDFDFPALRRLSDEMLRLKAIPTSHKDYAAAQVAHEDLRTDYLAMKNEYQQQYATDPANPARALAAPEATEQAAATNDLGPVDAGVMSAANTMSFGLGKPAAMAVHAGTAGGPTGTDVSAQWDATTAAHPTADKIGMGAGIAISLLTGKIGGSMRKSLGPIAASPALRAGGAVYKAAMNMLSARKAAQVADAAAKAVAPSSSVVAKIGAEKAAEAATQAATGAAEQLAAGLAKAQADELAIQALAKTNALMREGFALVDAQEMVQAGTHVANRLWMPLMKGARAHVARAAQVAPPVP